MVNPESSTVKEPITINESRQYTSLAKKALSFQKRQKFTNICCITLCPLIMVVISAGLGGLIQTLITRSTVIYGIMKAND